MKTTDRMFVARLRLTCAGIEQAFGVDAGVLQDAIHRRLDDWPVDQHAWMEIVRGAMGELSALSTDQHLQPWIDRLVSPRHSSGWAFPICLMRPHLWDETAISEFLASLHRGEDKDKVRELLTGLEGLSDAERQQRGIDLSNLLADAIEILEEGTDRRMVRIDRVWNDVGSFDELLSDLEDGTSFKAMVLRLRHEHFRNHTRVARGSGSDRQGPRPRSEDSTASSIEVQQMAQATYVLLDTEFTSLNYPKLISLGLVTADGRKSYYAELSDTYRQVDISPFVWHEVRKHLQGSEFAKPREQVGNELREWFRALAACRIVILNDALEYDGLLMKTNFAKDLTGLPIEYCRFDSLSMGVEFAVRLRNARQVYFNDKRPQHHALHDAFALRAMLTEAWYLG